MGRADEPPEDPDDEQPDDHIASRFMKPFQLVPGKPGDENAATSDQWNRRTTGSQTRIVEPVPGFVDRCRRYCTADSNLSR